MLRHIYLTAIFTILIFSNGFAQTQIELRFGNGTIFENSGVTNSQGHTANISHGYTEFGIIALNTSVWGNLWLKSELGIYLSEASLEYTLSNQSHSFPGSARHIVREISYAVLPEFRYVITDAATNSLTLFVNAGPSLIGELSNSLSVNFGGSPYKIGALAHIGIIGQLNSIGIIFQIGYRMHKPGIWMEPLIPQNVWNTLTVSQGLVYSF